MAEQYVGMDLHRRPSVIVREDVDGDAGVDTKSWDVRLRKVAGDRARPRNAGARPLRSDRYGGEVTG